MLAVPCLIIEPIWRQLEALIPIVLDEHPLGCRRPRMPERVVFDKLILVLVRGAADERIADSTCSATTIRHRRDEWTGPVVLAELGQICLDACNEMIGRELEESAVDACIVKVPRGDEAAA